MPGSSSPCDMDGLKRYLQQCEADGQLQGLTPTKFNQMIVKSGGNPVLAIEKLVKKGGPMGNLGKMLAAGLGDSTLEGAVLKFSGCFSSTTVQEAAKRLGKQVP